MYLLAPPIAKLQNPRHNTKLIKVKQLRYNFCNFLVTLCMNCPYQNRADNNDFMLVSSVKTFGRYCMFLTQVFKSPDKWGIFGRKTVQEIYKLGVDSIPLVIIISIFIGAVIAIQMTLNIDSPIIPKYATGMSTREILVLEFSSTMLCLILAGKVGSNISSEIGTMRITEQLDAMDIMGVNSANYVVLPKLVGFLIFVPVLTILSIFVGIVGGWLVGEFSSMFTVEHYVFGLRTMFIPWHVYYALIKTVVFAFIIVTDAAFYGYYVKGGSIDVGNASTSAVVSSSILILLSDVILTKLLLQ